MTIAVPDGVERPYEITEEEVLGRRLAVFRHRRRHLGELVEASARYGDREYLVFPRRRLTYAEHHAAVTATARLLRDRYGVGPGSRVAILAANAPEWIVAFWAAVGLGGVVVALNAWWAGEEIEYALGDADPVLLVADRERLDRLRTAPACPVLPIETLLDRVEPGPAVPLGPVREDDPAVVLYTSGTSGRPKGAVHTHRNILAQLQVQASLAAGSPPGGPPARIFSSSPFFHVSGLHGGALARLASGAVFVGYEGRFDAVSVMRTIERERCTAWSAVPTVVWRVVHHPDAGRYDLSSITRINGGGSAWSPALQERMRAVFGAGLVIGVGYGSTECTAWATIATAPGDLADHPTTVGRPVPTVEVEIRDPDGKPLPEGEEGEIHVRSPLVMLGYWHDDEATAGALDGDGWLRMGDLGTFRDGLLYLASRRTDLILRGGENVYPAEIENCLEAHPGVAECVVVGVPHEELGQEVAAVVVPRAGSPVDAGELAAHVAGRLARFKVPSRWIIRTDPLPRTASGKVVRADVTAGE
ncbi:class I adenylate-forming enzyme family protein [Spirillospora sp. NPDC029432]|uniref:class I adenylate-forming enzyme family protein n=1 Tax=Spirillospora sp. NPDC029432 TaxID=3154599 RepID=UPI003452161F